MSPPNETDYAQAREKIAHLIESPEDSRSLLPAVVGMLDHEDRQLRLSAACGVCLIGTAQPDLVDYLIKRLIDRVHDDAERAEAIFAFEYLASQFPEQVDESLEEIRRHSDREPLAYTRSGGFRRSNIYSPSMGAEGVGRTRVAGEGQSSGPQQVYTEDADEKDIEDPAESEAEADAEAGPNGDEESDTAEDSEETDDGEDTAEDGETEPATDSADVETDAEEMRLPTDVLTAILEDSYFDDITILSRHDRERFDDTYRMLGISRGHERAVSLRLFHRPEEGEAAFLDRLADALSAWERLDHQHVTRLYDWSLEPRPWAAVAYADETLAERERFDPREALWNAIVLTQAVSHLHTNNVVHGGIDPHAIGYSEDLIDDDLLAPQLDHVGLLEAFRYAFDPSLFVDPRYAAPEYFDPSFGAIDHATDIYQLGAVCYRLFAGVSPFEADPEDVPQHVLRSQPPSISADLDSVPPAVDQVIQKAMAKQKLTRYENVAQMEQDLLGIRDQLAHNG